MREIFWKYDSAIKILFFLFILALAADRVILHTPQIKPSPLAEFTLPQLENKDDCGDKCKETINKEVAQAVATLSAQKQTTVITTKPSTEPKITYVPLSGTFSTKNTDWTDVKNSDVNIKIEDYGKNPYVDWNAFIKIDQGNGQVSARLFDVTHSIGVAESELKSTTSTPTLTSSGRLQLWSGNNLYRVQIKSLNGYEATFDSGRVKIVSQ